MKKEFTEAKIMECDTSKEFFQMCLDALIYMDLESFPFVISKQFCERMIEDVNIRDFKE